MSFETEYQNWLGQRRIRVILKRTIRKNDRGGKRRCLLS